MNAKLLFAVATTLFAMPVAADAAAFQNGSLENGSFDQAANSHVLSTDSTAITGWTVLGGNVEWDKNGNGYGITASDGSYSVDLSGNPDGLGMGLQQVFDTIAGHTYALSFDVGANGAYTPQSGAFIQALIDGAALFVGGNANVVTGQSWATATGSFTATGASTTLGLTGFSGLNYIGLDNVQVTDVTPAASGAVPEPATWGMMIAGFGLAGAALRRRDRVSRRALAAA